MLDRAALQTPPPRASSVPTMSARYGGSVDATTAFVMALLALVVAAAGLVLSLLTFLHSRRRDFPRAKLRIEWRNTDGKISARVRNVGAAAATRVESKVWHIGPGVWRDLGPWMVGIEPGEEYSVVTFADDDAEKRVQVVWYDAARPDVRRTVSSRWKASRAS